MTVVPFLVIAAICGTGSLVLRARRGWSTAVALIGLAALTAAAVAMGPTASVEIGGSRLLGSEWLRLYAILGSVVGLLLVLVDVTAVHEPDAPGVIVLGLGAAVLALALTDPGVAVVAATAGGLAGVLVAAPLGAAARAAFVGIRELRALAISRRRGWPARSGTSSRPRRSSAPHTSRSPRPSPSASGRSPSICGPRESPTRRRASPCHS